MSKGLNLVKTGLVFGYDIGNHRYYPGEPTTNLLPSASTNAIPKTGNAWGTYNTNQYNGAAYFSIGTISSVSNNIVTTAGTHPLRSFDVVTPQTTGGGVTAGVNYLIKKLSSTTFSIHSYNGSQDGSQGYTNPSTGMFKVYDDYANDTRVSINSSSFPNMWWGPPHLPNSGLVKEVITNGFTNPLNSFTSDCLRQHVHRSDGVADHMAYGVDASFTPNSPVYASFWAKSVDENAVGKSINFYHYTYGVQSATDYSTSAVLGPVGAWKRYGYTFTSPNNTAISYWFNPSGPYKYDIANIQFEQKNHPTTFTTSSRSNTTSLLDKKRTSTLNVSNMSFDSNGNLIFDGTNDSIVVSDASHLRFSDGKFSVEAVLNISSISSKQRIVSKGSSGWSRGWHIAARPTQWELELSDGVSSPGNSFLINTTTTVGINHIVWVFSATTAKLYVNGVQLGSTQTITESLDFATGTSNLGIGAFESGGEYLNGYIHNVRIYNRDITALEIDQNYKAYKRRFSLP